MRSVLQVYEAGLRDLRQFVRTAGQVDALANSVHGSGAQDKAGKSLDPVCLELISSSTSRKSFFYSAAVVSLYGLFEAFVEELVLAFLRGLDEVCPSFSDLPDAIQSGHVDASANLLLRRSLDKYSSRCTVAEIVARVSRQNAGAGVRRVNELAFIDHRSNFRSDSLTEFFALAGLPGVLTSAKADPVFQDHLRQAEGLTGIASLKNSVVLRDLDDLVQRRNEVAHGNPSMILGETEMEARVVFMRELGGAIFRAVEMEYVRFQLKHRSTQLPPPIAVHGGKIACFALEGGAVAVGDRIVARNSKGKLRYGAVERIEVEGVAYERLELSEKTEVALQLGFGVKAQHEFFVTESNVDSG